MTTWQAMQAAAVAGNAAFALFVLAAARYWMPPPVALLVAVAALASPFLVMLHYKFHGFAWASLAYAAHGMLLWAMVRPGADRKVLNGWAAVAIALSVATHIISALVNLLVWSAAAAVHARQQARPGRPLALRPLVGWAATAGLGLALSAAYLVPALATMKYMSAQVWAGDYRTESFAWPVLTLLMGRDMQWAAIQWPVSLPALFLLVAVLVFLARRAADGGRVRAVLAAVAAASGTAAVFASELSYPIWTFQNPISQINLPYRFIAVLYIVAPFAAGLALTSALVSGRRAWAWCMGSLLALTVVAGVGALVKASYIDGRPLVPEVLEDRYSFEPLRQRFLQEDYLQRCAAERDTCIWRDRAAGGYRGIPEYGLAWSKGDPAVLAHSGVAGQCSLSGVRCGELRRVGNGLALAYEAQQGLTLLLPHYWYPAWTATAGGAPAALRADPATGLMAVDLPAGAGELVIQWRRMAVEQVGMAVTGLALVVLGLSAWWSRRRTAA
jgi:hypothetical protein